MSFLNTIWDVLWSLLLIYAFVVFIFALFAVIRDLFRDHEMNGWVKALWIILLVFVPFITVLIYVVARGRKMAERNIKDQAAAQEAAKHYIRDVAGTSASDEIAKAKALYDAGTITAQEFETLKAKSLS
ncbi:MAG TPA: SHOCT domain-containing protein [Microbacteriaceae bacterium]|nr:SHOCT domain-containing protein [Microbacteriaceae bacterium]